MTKDELRKIIYDSLEKTKRETVNMNKADELSYILGFLMGVRDDKYEGITDSDILDLLFEFVLKSVAK